MRNDSSMKLLLGTNIYGDNIRQDIAQESWMYLEKKFPDTFKPIAIQFKSEDLRLKYLNDFLTYSDYKIDVEYVLESSSKDLCLTHKELPITKEVFSNIYRLAKERGYTHFGYVNSDCILTEAFINHIQNNNITATAFSRFDIEPVNSFNDLKTNGVKIVRCEIAGFDCFVFSVDWYEKYQDLFKCYFIGITLSLIILAVCLVLSRGLAYITLIFFFLKMFFNIST